MSCGEKVDVKDYSIHWVRDVTRVPDGKGNTLELMPDRTVTLELSFRGTIESIIKLKDLIDSHINNLDVVNPRNRKTVVGGIMDLPPQLGDLLKSYVELVNSTTAHVDQLAENLQTYEESLRKYAEWLYSQGLDISWWHNLYNKPTSSN